MHACRRKCYTEIYSGVPPFSRYYNTTGTCMGSNYCLEVHCNHSSFVPMKHLRRTPFVVVATLTCARQPLEIKMKSLTIDELDYDEEHAKVKARVCVVVTIHSVLREGEAFMIHQCHPLHVMRTSGKLSKHIQYATCLMPVVPPCMYIQVRSMPSPCIGLSRL